jgi:hypothetical protein
MTGCLVGGLVALAGLIWLGSCSAIWRDRR